MFITDHNLQIRQLEESDMADLYEIYGDENTSRYLLSDAWNSFSKEEAFQKKLNINATEGSSCLAVVKDSKVIGTLSVWKKEMQDTYEIGYVFHKDYRHHGYASASVKKLIEDLFVSRKAHRVFAELDARNLDSVKLLERCGFIKEAHFRQDCFSKGEWTDTLIYSLLENDYYFYSKDRKY